MGTLQLAKTITEMSETAPIIDTPVIRKTDYKKRLLYRNAAGVLIMAVIAVLVWAIVDMVVSVAVNNMLSKVVKDTIDVASAEYNAYITAAISDGRMSDIMEKRGMSLVSTRVGSFNALERVIIDYQNSLVLVTRLLVYLCVLISCIAVGVFLRNNPDVLISSWGTLQKRVFIAGLQESLLLDTELAEDAAIKARERDDRARKDWESKFQYRDDKRKITVKK